jgi:RNA-binding protein
VARVVENGASRGEQKITPALFAEPNRRVQNIWRNKPFHYALRMAEALTNRELRELKARAQLLKPMLKVGKDGLSPAFLQATDDALTHHELVKVKFDEFKEQKKELALKLADGVAAQLVMQVGHVVVLFRRKPVEPA